ncbi:hypothetical protein V8E53_014555 [Lactarius tabidus]
MLVRFSPRLTRQSVRQEVALTSRHRDPFSHGRYTKLRTANPMLYSRTILARNASSIPSFFSRLPTELSTHPLLFTISTKPQPPLSSQLVTALSSLSAPGSIGCLSARSLAHPSHTR